jgi:hypothetical protein
MRGAEHTAEGLAIGSQGHDEGTTKARIFNARSRSTTHQALYTVSWQQQHKKTAESVQAIFALVRRSALATVVKRLTACDRRTGCS